MLGLCKYEWGSRLVYNELGACVSAADSNLLHTYTYTVVHDITSDRTLRQKIDNGQPDAIPPINTHVYVPCFIVD